MRGQCTVDMKGSAADEEWNRRDGENGESGKENSDCSARQALQQRGTQETADSEEGEIEEDLDRDRPARSIEGIAVLETPILDQEEIEHEMLHIVFGIDEGLAQHGDERPLQRYAGEQRDEMERI